MRKRTRTLKPDETLKSTPAQMPKKHLLSRASVNEVLEAFKSDSCIVEVARDWPSSPSEKVALVAKARRPADRILGLVWELWRFDKDEFCKVFAVWSKTATDKIHTWTFGEMFDHMKQHPNWVPQPFDPKKWAGVQSWRPGMRANPPSEIGPLIAYEMTRGKIDLEDGHTRLMAAHLEGVFPSAVLLYVGSPPH